MQARSSQVVNKWLKLFPFLSDPLVCRHPTVETYLFLFDVPGQRRDLSVAPYKMFRLVVREFIKAIDATMLPADAANIREFFPGRGGHVESLLFLNAVAVVVARLIIFRVTVHTWPRLVIDGFAMRLFS